VTAPSRRNRATEPFLTEEDPRTPAHAEDALRRSEEWLQLASQVGKIGVWDWDILSDRVAWTASLYGIHGITPAEFPPTIAGFTTLVHPEDQPRVAESIRRSLEEGAPYELEFRGVRPDGGIVWLFTSAVVIREGDRPIRMLGATVDVTERKRTDLELQESEARFRQLADTIPQLAWIAQPDGAVFWFNRRWYEYTGTTPQDVEGWGWQSVHHPLELPDVLERWRRSLATGEPLEKVHPLRGADGLFRPFLTRMVALKDASGRVTCWFGTSTDVAEQKTIEEQQRLLVSLADATRNLGSPDDVIWEVVSRVGRYLGVNRCTYGEVDPDQEYVTVVRDYVDGSASIAGRHRLDDFGPEVIRILRSGRTLVISDVTQDERTNGPTEAAAYRGIEAVSLLCVPLVKMGRLVAVFVLHDRSPRVWTRHERAVMEQAAERIWAAVDEARFEQAQRRQNERLRLLSETAEHLLTTEDPDLMVRGLFERVRDHLQVDAYCNFAFLEGGEGLDLVSCRGIPDDALPKIAHLDLGQGVCGRVALARKEIVATGVQSSSEPAVQIVKSLGFRVYACLPLLAGGRLLGTLSFASRRRDRFESDELELLRTLCHYVAAALERVRLIGELREADRRKDEFLATLAHELRNPLAPIRNALEILKRASGDAKASDSARAVMDRQLQQMVRLIDDLLDLSRISRGKIELRKETVALDAVLRAALETSEPALAEKEHALSLDLPDRPLLVHADATRLAQVFANLLNNAAKYTPSGGRIEVGVAAEDGEARVRVRDDGAGIAPEMLPLVFEMFTQIDQPWERAHGGLGIGLTIVKRLVEMHGGTVEAHSAGVKRGSEFVVRLPLQDGLGDAPALDAAEAEGASSRHRVLVTDDNVDAAESLGALLEILGHDVRTVHDGEAALELAESFRPDLILLDIGMPGLNGYEVCRRIRSRPWGREVFVVALTGWGQEEDRRRSRESGFDHHLVKPLDPTALEKVLSVEAARRSSGDEDRASPAGCDRPPPT
jgi:PAS domain S-box-containing protein